MASNINVTPQFVLAGEATFTVSNQRGTHFTYHVYKTEPNGQWRYPANFVKVLSAPDTYTYVGRIGNIHDQLGPIMALTRNSRYMDHHECVKVLRWALRAIWQTANTGYKLPDGYSIKHDGKCGRCGARLTHPASLDTGLGPGCAEIVGVEWRERAEEERREQGALPIERNFGKPAHAGGGR